MDKSQFEFVKNNVPDYVRSAAKTLIDNGFEAYLVGGSIRDLLLSKTPKDYDIATNAYPEKIQEIFAKSVPTGAQFGTIVVLIEDKQGETQEIEITTYRSEADYYGGRWPAKVEFTKTIQEDLSRRDFTINAIALDLDFTDEVKNTSLVDPYGGMDDLKIGILKAVGDPVERFTEDGLRPLRACRLAANLNFEIEKNTFAAITKTLTIVDNVSKERVRDELVKMLYNSAKPSKGLELMRRSGILEIFIPELLEGVGINQPKYHVDDVYNHSLKTLDAAEDEVKLAALFHDIAKPRTISIDKKGTHFYGHDVLSSKMAVEIMKRLKFPNKEIKRIETLIRHHMFYYPNADWRKQQTQEFADSIQTEVKSKTTQVLILRHGLTSENEKGIVSGQLNHKLNETGIKQAKSCVNDLKNLGINVIITSPLKRASQTAEIISSDLNIKLTSDSRFKERHFGELQGKTWAEFSNIHPNLAMDPANSPQKQTNLPGGESLLHIESRVKVGLYNHIKENFGQLILIVTHQGISRVIQRILFPVLTEASQKYLDELDINENSVIDLDNCQYLKLEIDHQKLDPNFLTDDELEIIRQEQTSEKVKHPGGWSDGAVRRFIRNVGGEEMIDQLMKLRIADASANPKSLFNPKELQLLSERIAVIKKQDMALKVTDLDVSGSDLIETFNLKPGPVIGNTLEHLLEKVLEDPLLNDKERLLKIAQVYIETRQKLNTHTIHGSQSTELS